MAQEHGPFVGSLKREHRLLWLLLGVGVSLPVSAQLFQKELASIGLSIGLLAVYYGAGQLAARWVARSTARSPYSEPGVALFASSAKIGALFSVLSISFHLALLAAFHGEAPLDWPALVDGPILLRAAILPLLACMGAACTIKSPPPRERREMVQYPTRSNLSPHVSTK